MELLLVFFLGSYDDGPGVFATLIKINIAFEIFLISSLILPLPKLLSEIWQFYILLDW